MDLLLCSLCSALSPLAHTLISVINAHFVSGCFCNPPCVGEEREREHERDFQTHLLLWQSGLWQKKDRDDFWHTLTERKFPETLCEAQKKARRGKSRYIPEKMLKFSLYFHVPSNRSVRKYVVINPVKFTSPVCASRIRPFAVTANVCRIMGICTPSAVDVKWVNGRYTTADMESNGKQKSTNTSSAALYGCTVITFFAIDEIS